MTETETETREGWAWGVPQRTSHGLTLALVSELLPTRADVPRRGYGGTVAYVREVADPFVGGSYWLVVKPEFGTEDVARMIATTVSEDVVDVGKTGTSSLTLTMRNGQRFDVTVKRH
jgi:hypothetical protein